jgi:hypothetical protein
VLLNESLPDIAIGIDTGRIVKKKQQPDKYRQNNGAAQQPGVGTEPGKNEHRDEHANGSPTKKIRGHRRLNRKQDDESRNGKK